MLLSTTSTLYLTCSSRWPVQGHSWLCGTQALPGLNRICGAYGKQAENVPYALHIIATLSVQQSLTVNLIWAISSSSTFLFCTPSVANCGPCMSENVSSPTSRSGAYVHILCGMLVICVIFSKFFWGLLMVCSQDLYMHFYTNCCNWSFQEKNGEDMVILPHISLAIGTLTD